MSTSHARKEREPLEALVHRPKKLSAYPVEDWARKTWHVKGPGAPGSGVKDKEKVSITAAPLSPPIPNQFQMTISVGSAPDWQEIKMIATNGDFSVSGNANDAAKTAFTIVSQTSGGINQQLECDEGSGSGGAVWTAQEG